MQGYKREATVDAIGKLRVGFGKKADERIDHHIADEVNSRLRNAFAEQVLVAVFGRSEEEIRQTIGEQAVDLLGHRVVARTESGFDVAYRYSELRADEGGGQSGVHIAVDEDEMGLTLDHDRLECGHDSGCLLAVSSRADAEIHVRLGHFELAEEHVGHGSSVVLTGVDQSLADFGICAQGAQNRIGFHEVGARAYDMENVHWVLSSDFSW